MFCYFCRNIDDIWLIPSQIYGLWYKANILVQKMHFSVKFIWLIPMGQIIVLKIAMYKLPKYLL